jgi:hypothetical protein
MHVNKSQAMHATHNRIKLIGTLTKLQEYNIYLCKHKFSYAYATHNRINSHNDNKQAQW